MAEDVSGEVFLRAFKDRHRFDPTYQSARPWLYGIASNLVQDHRRRSARRYRAYNRISAADVVAVGFEDEVAARVDAAASSGMLHKALLALRPEQAVVVVVVLYVIEDRTYQDIADILEIPIGTVRSRLSRARQMLRNSIGPIDEQDPGDD